MHLEYERLELLASAQQPGMNLPHFQTVKSLENTSEQVNSIVVTNLANHKILEERNPNEMIEHGLFKLPAIQRLELSGLGAVNKHDAIVGDNDVLLVNFVLWYDNEVVGVVALSLNQPESV